MTSITIKTGNIFTSKCQTLVNTVNCDGVMGAGIALEFRLRLPEMFEKYVEHCRAGRIVVGALWIYKPPARAREQRWVLNFPTKRHWKNPSRIEYLEAGLEKFLRTCHGRGIQSIAFPLLGAANGGLTEDESRSVMRRYLSQCSIPVEIYRYDPTATDDLYEEFRGKLLRPDHPDDRGMAKAMGLRIDQFRKVCDTLEGRQDKINSLGQLASVKGIGLKTLEKCFHYVMDAPDTVGADTVAPALF